MTGKRVKYIPYQEMASHYKSISTAEFQRAIQYVDEDGKIFSAAQASFLVLSQATGWSLWLFLYKKLPGFSAFSEWAYAFIAAHRPAFYRISLWLWGRRHSPSKFNNISWLFLRTLGLIYFSAFISFGVQAMGLIGSHGILPLSAIINATEQQLGLVRYWLVPTVFWFNSSDIFIQAVCWAGAALSLLVVFNILPRLSLFLIYLLYLSLIYGGQTFMTFQWDILLVDMGFLGLILSITVKPGILLLRWLCFRFVFLSGVVKISSGDPSWRDLSALTYHFQTQPLPTPLAWYAHQLPTSVLAFMTFSTLFIELIFPFFIFFPRRLRFIAGFGILLLQTIIALTGNYNFFNLLAILLCLSLFDDAALQFALPRQIVLYLKSRRMIKEPRKIVFRIMASLTAIIIFASCVLLAIALGDQPPAPLTFINALISPFHVANNYGPFAVMTTKRQEIIIEGSNDNVNWKEYGFKYKPGDVTRPPSWNIPHQPRLDWQMWFAALESPYQNPWFRRFLECLLQGQTPVVSLLATNPFPDHPPLYVRAQFYNYRFATPKEHEQTGAWWVRDLVGDYFPVVTLK